MKKHYILLIVICSLCCSSCEKLLDKEPTDQVSLEDLFRDVAGAKTALAGAYDALRSTSHYQRNLMVYPDLSGGNIKYSKANGLVLDDIYTANQTELESSMDETYSSLYQELNNINNIIKYAPSATGYEADKIKIIAEAKCLRALAHFDLLRIFSWPINRTPAGTHPGIVINMEPYLVADDRRPRLSSAASFQAVVNDLNEAIASFDDGNTGILTGGYKQNFFTKASAQALLAKVYLYQNNWDMAFNTADNLIRSNQYTLLNNASYVNSWTGRVPSSESIFELAMETNFSGTSLGNYFDATSTNIMFAATSNLTSLYTSTDIRRPATMFNATTISGTSYNFTKKYATGGTNATPLKVLRLSELYLIRAEAAVAKSAPDYAQANADLDVIRKRADPYATTLDLQDKTALIDAILLERRKELAFEGNLIFDLLRYNKDVARADGNPEQPNFTANDYRLIMPIPYISVNTNPSMEQNPGY
ncbi:putative outer membrane receptor protein [Pedobacter sp. BAL39]|uniref:RagB/SusD family nutrient uptake outer membrane protein n=1 Tax=Pedobacter sp. BAL39 TaxID=391596 RepID=UPI0001559727|nr:RagB/SusD family nutrient uptake outer membrane protein [Pedobacter sp. BAL39]EDM36706.1 putative outer membrane receptor protein [Pedobacter sp. BAL39]